MPAKVWEVVMRSRFWMAGMAALALVAGTKPGRAQNPDGVADDLRHGVARISFLMGEVSIQRGDSGEWVAGAVNAPILANDRISTGTNSRAEIEFEFGDVLRIGGEADLTITALEENRCQLAL